MLVLDLDIARALIASVFNVGNYLCPRRSCALRVIFSSWALLVGKEENNSPGRKAGGKYRRVSNERVQESNLWSGLGILFEEWAAKRQLRSRLSSAVIEREESTTGSE